MKRNGKCELELLIERLNAREPPGPRKSGAITRLGVKMSKLASHPTENGENEKAEAPTS